ncbi:alpha/beta hydrolase [uncultured Caulobacter sp.]|uniref:alpha/beta hydrolase n=1 Tax=uncultured Caulobacter sp. TaxID=158749 RepID=UPI002607ED64|nr:alpha/beta hydrolase [uncultured Caulobacter sp.]
MNNALSRRLLGLVAGASACLLALGAHAAPGEWVNGVTAIPTPKEPPTFALPVATPLANPAREAWAQQDPKQRLVYNVSRPTLTLMPGGPPADRAAPAVILIPGGGYQFLAMDNEGYDVAKRLSPLGVRVFILKYRTLPLPDSFDGFKAALAATFQRGEGAEERARQIPYAVADAQAAIRAVRAHARDWGVDPARVGILGFSAGAMTTLGALQANAADARPDFAGMIYGPTESSTVPANAPPLFAALAADDRFFRSQDLSLIHNWRRAGGSVELHLYSAGGHGFASQPHGTTSDAWFDQYALWLKAMKFAP